MNKKYTLTYTIKKINNQSIDRLYDLADDAIKDRYDFVERTIIEWKNVSNQFSGKNEILFAAFENEACIGIGGLNVDPYLNDETVGRVRHLYVSREWRGKGVGTLLLKRIIEYATNSFTRIRLYTENPIAEHSYERNGFIKSSEYKCSHSLEQNE